LTTVFSLRELQMEDWKKKSGLGGLLNSEVNPPYDDGLGLSGALDQASGIGLSDEHSTAIERIARSLLERDTPPRTLGLINQAMSEPEEPSSRLLSLARALLAPSPDSEAFIDAVWAKAVPIPGVDAHYVRRDRFGDSIARYDYGKCTAFGWHMDHSFPKSLGGSDELFNREPLHWRNNLAKSDSVF
jgi:hypothetical protein